MKRKESQCTRTHKREHGTLYTECARNYTLTCSAFVSKILLYLLLLLLYFVMINEN